jgi:hypothetical protein
VNLDNPHTHHDALEFPDGRIVLLTHLRPGQHASVLQLGLAVAQFGQFDEQNKPSNSLASRDSPTMRRLILACASRIAI